MSNTDLPDIRRLLAVASHFGHPEMPETVEALRVAVERGHQIGVAAAAGSGIELLYGLAVAGKCDPALEEVQAVILTPTPETGIRSACVVGAVTEGTGIETAGWPLDRGFGSGPGRPPVAQIIVGRPGAILADVRSGRLGLSELRLVVVHEVDALIRLGAWDACSALLDTAGPETQKILCSAAPGDAFGDLVVSKLPRARRWPPELFPGPDREPETDGKSSQVPLWLGDAAGEMARLLLLAEGLARLSQTADLETAVVGCDLESTATRVRAGLRARGFRMADGAAEPGVRVVWGPGQEGCEGAAALFGLPSGLPAMLRGLESAAARLAIVPTGHRAQIELLARRAGWPVRDLPSPIPSNAADEITAFRDRVRDRAEGGGGVGDLLLLEPLLEELGGARVAAALAGLLRGEARADETAGSTPLAAWTRIFVNVGRQDGAGPADLVGAITGETSAVGAQIGKIEMRPRHSLIDLDSLVAEEVIQQLSGTRIKGRVVTARVDRTS